MSADPLLDDCGCCAGRSADEPTPIDNRPGLTTLHARLGTHASFKQAMLASLAAPPALDKLRTRDDTDPAIALLDAFAMSLDVLCFYQERIANEGYLRTATERRSVLELARTIGYELSPGLAASTRLAFGMETSPGAPQRITLPIGTRAQSIPGPDEMPQIFETVEAIEARPAWNALQVRTTSLRPLVGSTDVDLVGIATALAAGDMLLFVAGERRDGSNPKAWEVRRITRVQVDFDAQRTRVFFAEAIGTKVGFLPASRIELFVMRQRAGIFGFNAPDWKSLADETKASYLQLADKSELSAGDRLEWPDFSIYAPTYPEAYKPMMLGGMLRGPGGGSGKVTALIGSGWPLGVELNRSTDRIDLDMVYRGVVGASWVVLTSPSGAELFNVTQATEAARAQYLLSGKTTRLQLGGASLAQFASALRHTMVFAQSEGLQQAESPIPEPLPRNTLGIDAPLDGLVKGRWVSVTGKVWHAADQIDTAFSSELARISNVDLANRTISFDDDLANPYQRRSVTINANVASATHGETRAEVLGSGDASKPLQRFVLQQSPLTHVSAKNADGAASTLTIRVNDVKWEEVPALYGQGATDRIFATQQGDDGRTGVQFGNGSQGARLPTGTENVVARYRIGTGRAGLVKAGQISLLMSRPLGLRDVINPAAPEGAEDPQSLASARGGAPVTVLTLDRIVSVRDFEDFARGFKGIARARADWLWDGEKRIVHLSVAGTDGRPVSMTSDVHINLRHAIDAARHADVAVRLASLEARSFGLQAKLAIDPAFEPDKVKQAVRNALQVAFSFDAMDFARTVSAAQVIAVIQRVRGVVALDLDHLGFAWAPPKTVAEYLFALPARWEAGVLQPAQLITIDMSRVVFEEMTA